MISTVVIEGFQNHKKLVLKLDPHVTVLVGSNGAGKSAVVRALKWLTLNQWDGKADHMLNWDMTETTVKAWIDKRKIVRSKGPEGNLYVLDKEKPFEAVGAGKLPEAIKTILNITEENFQEQLDPAFWFHLTAGQVAKSLNKIVNLSSIDTSLEQVARELRESREKVRASEQRLTEARNLKESLSWVKDAADRLKSIEATDAKIDGTLENINGLTRSLVQLRKIEQLKTGATSVILCGQKVIKTGQEYSTYRNKIKDLQSLATGVEIQEDRTCKLREKLTKAQDRLAKLMKDGFRCPLCGKVTQLPHSPSATCT